MNQDFPADQMDWLRENLPVETRIAPYLGIYYYAVNLMNAPLDQTAIRQALSMVIDRETIVDYVMRTGEVAAYSFVPPGVGNYGDPVQSDWAGLPMEERTTTALTRTVPCPAQIEANISRRLSSRRAVGEAVRAIRLGHPALGFRALVTNTGTSPSASSLPPDFRFRWRLAAWQSCWPWSSGSRSEP